MENLYLDIVKKQIYKDISESISKYHKKYKFAYHGTKILDNNGKEISIVSYIIIKDIETNAEIYIPIDDFIKNTLRKKTINNTNEIEDY